ncbi:MAG TPA: hypothetical protein VJ572_12540 [Azonexus sp.]|nr:hypothetical protein [Azonexus sp.]
MQFAGRHDTDQFLQLNRRRQSLQIAHAGRPEIDGQSFDQTTVVVHHRRTETRTLAANGFENFADGFTAGHDFFMAADKRTQGCRNMNRNNGRFSKHG